MGGAYLNFWIHEFGQEIIYMAILSSLLIQVRQMSV